MPVLLKKRPRIGTVSLPSYSIGEISDRPAKFKDTEEQTPPLSGEQHVYTEKKKLMAAIFGDKLPQVGRGNNSQNEDARIRREPKRDLKACIQEKSEYS